MVMSKKTLGLAILVKIDEDAERGGVGKRKNIEKDFFKSRKKDSKQMLDSINWRRRAVKYNHYKLGKLDET